MSDDEWWKTAKVEDIIVSEEAYNKFVEMLDAQETEEQKKGIARLKEAADVFDMRGFNSE